MLSPEVADLVVYLEPVHLVACSVCQGYNCAFFVEKMRLLFRVFIGWYVSLSGDPAC